ncbi:MAG: GNAT family N-acetyltransferase [Pseudomonadota bacterium]
MDTLTISQVSATDADVSALLLRHEALMRAGSPEESCHVMDPATLDAAGVTLLAARSDTHLLGVGGLIVIEPHHGEIKSMHTTPAARGRGVGRAILVALIDLAQSRNLTRLSLETGTDDSFAAARALYHGEGFIPCPPFGSYKFDPLSAFMTRTI